MIERVSPHFSLAELTTTQVREFLDVQAAPPPDVRGNLFRLAVLALEPARSIVGPLRVNSGWRSPGLNAAIGGARNSAHLAGLAADVVPVVLDVREGFDRLAASRIAFDQLIFERPSKSGAAWIHMAIAPKGQAARGECLALYAPGRYQRWDPQDPEWKGTV